MKADVKKILILVLVVIAMAAYFLRTSNILYIPGVSTGALAIGMGMLAVDMLGHREQKRNKIMGILLAAFALLMVFTCCAELIAYFNG